MKPLRFVALVVGVLLIFSVPFAFAGAPKEEKEKGKMKPSEVTIGMSLFMAMPFTETIRMAAEAAAEDFGCNVEVVAPATYDPDQQLAQFESLVAKRVDGILVQPVPEDFFTVPINRAVDSGIPVITFDITPFDSEATAFLGPSGTVSGGKLADATLKLLKEMGHTSGKVIVAIGLPGDVILEARARSFLNAFKGTDFTVLGPFDSGTEQADTYAFWESTYAAHPDMLLAVGTTALDLPNIYKFKLKTPGADFLAVGWDEEIEALQAIKEGYGLATCGEHPYLYGYLGVKAFFDHFVKGEPLPQGWIYHGGEIVTKDNVDEILARESNPQKQHEWYKGYVKKNFPTLGKMWEPLENLKKMDKPQ
jgi:ribose transport system substrate-binding protein